MNVRNEKENFSLEKEVVKVLTGVTSKDCLAIQIKGPRDVVPLEEINKLWKRVKGVLGAVDLLVIDHQFTEGGGAAEDLRREIAEMSGAGSKLIIVVSDSQIEPVYLRLGDTENLFSRIIKRELDHAALEAAVPGSDTVFRSSRTQPLGSAVPDLRNAWEAGEFKAGELADDEDLKKGMQIVDSWISRDPPRICYIAITRDLQPAHDMSMRAKVIEHAVENGYVYVLDSKFCPVDNFEGHLLLARTPQEPSV